MRYFYNTSSRNQQLCPTRSEDLTFFAVYIGGYHFLCSISHVKVRISKLSDDLQYNPNFLLWVIGETPSMSLISQRRVHFNKINEMKHGWPFLQYFSLCTSGILLRHEHKSRGLIFWFLRKNETGSFRYLLLIKNSQFSSYHYEIWWKLPTHEYRFQNGKMKFSQKGQKKLNFPYSHFNIRILCIGQKWQNDAIFLLRSWWNNTKKFKILKISSNRK